MEERFCNKFFITTYAGQKVEVLVQSIPEKKKTVATAMGCRTLALASLNDVFYSIEDISVQSNSLLWKKLQMKDTYVSVVKCHPEDSFDTKQGVIEVLNKLERKLNQKIRSRRKTLACELIAMAERCDSSYNFMI